MLGLFVLQLSVWRAFSKVPTGCGRWCPAGEASCGLFASCSRAGQMDALSNERIFAKLVLFCRYRGYLYRLPRPRSPWNDSSSQGTVAGSLSARIASIESGNCLKLDGSRTGRMLFRLGFAWLARMASVESRNGIRVIPGFTLRTICRAGYRLAMRSSYYRARKHAVLGQRLILARAGLSPGNFCNHAARHHPLYQCLAGGQGQSEPYS